MLGAGSPRTTPTLSPSPITHTPISIHLHPDNSIPLRPSRLSSSHPPHPRCNSARGRVVALLRCGSFYVFSMKYEKSILYELCP